MSNAFRGPASFYTRKLPKPVQQVGVLGVLLFPPVQNGLIETDEVIEFPAIQLSNLCAETLAQVIPLPLGLATDLFFYACILPFMMQC